MKQDIDFTNASEFPIYVSGLNQSSMKDTYIAPWTTCTIHSDTGEFYADHCFPYLTEGHEKWLTMPSVPASIGKCRTMPCAMGDYSWMYTKEFDIIVDNKPEGITATFVYSGITISSLK